jgi:toxin-antitoxin system PIN domain toxin
MIVPDVNLLVYAYNLAAPSHRAARHWWEDLMTRQVPVGIPWAVSLGFIRLVTSPRVTPRPLPPRRATGIVRSWLTRSHVTVLEPGSRHLDLLEALFDDLGVSGRLTTDAHLAALAIEHHAELHSNDTDFGRFSGLGWVNPIGAR